MRAALIRAQVADRQGDVANVITNLLEAEKYATGRERDAIRLELAQRYRDSGQLEEAAPWFQKISREADQPGLRKRAKEKADAANAEVERLKKLREKRKKVPRMTSQTRTQPSNNLS